MLLILNCIINKSNIAYFDDVILEKIFIEFPNYKILHIGESAFEYDLSPFSHLLITGSELSASKENEWDNEIYRIIRYFIQKKKAILGICYGHQMLAKAILGNMSCRKAKIPEFGWQNTNIITNPIFENITEPIFALSHYDEVCNLTDDFSIIASTKECPVQGFQYKNLPIWGVQFHPEMDLDDGNGMIHNNLENNPSIKKYYLNELNEKRRIEQNRRIILNFVNA